jgi:hypothetical protein
MVVSMQSDWASGILMSVDSIPTEDELQTTFNAKISLFELRVIRIT